MIDRIGDIMEDTENEKAYYVLHYKAERMGEALHCVR